MEFYSIAEVSEMSGQSQKTIRRHIAAGKLKADKVGNCYRITKENYNKSGEEMYVCRITVTNKKLHEDLIKLGCIPNKSLILQFPSEEQVPK